MYNLVRVFSSDYQDSGNNGVKETVAMQEGLSESLLPSSSSIIHMKGKAKVVFHFHWSNLYPIYIILLKS